MRSFDAVQFDAVTLLVACLSLSNLQISFFLVGAAAAVAVQLNWLVQQGAEELPAHHDSNLVQCVHLT